VFEDKLKSGMDQTRHDSWTVETKNTPTYNPNKIPDRVFPYQALNIVG
jgi:hypothetical protein